MVDKTSKAEGRVLLPNYVIPTKYDLKLTPDLEKYTFDGIVAIDMTTSPTAGEFNTITLHAKELLFKTASLLVEGKKVSAQEVR